MASTTPGNDDASAAERDARVVAVQAAVDRVTSWQDGAALDTVRVELHRALAQVGAEVPESFVEEAARRIHRGEPHFDVRQLLG